MKRWLDCSMQATKDLKSVGVVTMTGEPALRFVSTGMSFPDIVKCAGAAGFRSSEDADHKYLVVEFPVRGRTFTQSYLALPNGAVFMRQAASRAAMGHAPTRAELEADVADVASHSTAADDVALQKLVAKVDRSKAMWFAGTAAGTPFAGQVKEAYGTIEAAPGLTVDINVQLADESLGAAVDEMWSRVKLAKARLPPALAGAIDNAKLERSGDRVHVTMSLDDEQVKVLVQLLGKFAR